MNEMDKHALEGIKKIIDEEPSSTDIDIFKFVNNAIRYEEALHFISEMPCVEDNCAACYAKKVLEGGE